MAGEKQLVADQAEPLVTPTQAELRLLAPRALRLWRAMVRARDRDGMQGDWFLRDLDALRRAAGIESYGSAKNALAALRRAGLVATRRHTVRREVWEDTRDGRIRTNVNANERNWYAVGGSLRTRSGVDTISFPTTWMAYVDRASSSARRHEVFVEARRPFFDSAAVWDRAWTRELVDGHGSQNEVAELVGRKVTSILLTSKRSLSLKRERDAAPPPTFLSEEEQDRSLLEMLSAPKRVLVPDPTWDEYRPLDERKKPGSPVQWVEKHLSDLAKVRLMIDGFNAACGKVFGRRGYMYANARDLTKVKTWKQLLATALAFEEHSIPPLHWAIWRLTFMRDKRGLKGPPGLAQVMSAKTVSKMAGWFRKDYDLPVTVHVVDEIRLEQMYRNQEAARRAVGFTGSGVWMALPAWYADKREREIILGFVRPHELWPTRERS